MPVVIPDDALQEAGLKSGEALVEFAWGAMPKSGELL